jgi:hypothetical protein
MMFFEKKSDTIIASAFLCVTSLGLTAMVSIRTYLKDKPKIEGRSSIGKLTKNEIAVTAEDKNPKN